jgi:superfamily I DNA/RNA helicase
VIELSKQQIAMIEAGLEPMSVLACAGSGKTSTAVHRLVHMSKALGGVRDRVALLSFSNVAVDTFRRGYQGLLAEMPCTTRRCRVDIDTLDGFITTNVLRPHAYRTMGSLRSAFLLLGSEAFLQGFKVNASNYPREIIDIGVGVEAGKFTFFCSSLTDDREMLDAAYAEGVVKRLGRTGGYTHNLGRYWCLRTLREQPFVLRALARRYPHLLIDEAQDIGTNHQAILEELIGAGVQISLIGDPNQGIYQFAGADGEFLRSYGSRAGVKARSLTRNYRCVPKISDIANKLSARHDIAHRMAPESTHGAFYIAYKNADREKLVAAFRVAVISAQLAVDKSAVLCRARDLAESLSGSRTVGQGAVKRFAKAAILRDQGKDFGRAFKEVAACIPSILAKPPDGLSAMLTQPAQHPEMRALRRVIWHFTRDADAGLPSASLTANQEWHARLIKNTKVLIELLGKKFDLAGTTTLGAKLANKKLPNTALVTAADLVAEEIKIRVDTVHQAKGESLDAVLYMANKEHASELLAGVNSEVGRVGYVALTRAKNLMWLGVPKNCLEELRPKLEEMGFQDAGVAF